ncbi:TetR/AcrR family transcriptional regulator C-terminal domain-containing protein [Streptomyces rapamycinicus]|uniref:TetR/AcrR family transcriptional regulator C-terminal domain-containing protein n=1 Tax=Streptomyces rapamycinicus TaxID=1226757 RepID=UPI0013157A58|nr:TetR/AcrR family transcriptional regulator C-terminal domain-containing protein [Streptomyces rapamycinicus]UTP34925.1 TetR/AcrR family transcriptional regulator C-terminal domain-containing protein [Streptomyces rapamycinicus NRRL 5491]
MDRGGFCRQGRGLIADVFAVCTEALVLDGRLRRSDARQAARKFMGLVPRFLVWPRAWPPKGPVSHSVVTGRAVIRGGCGAGAG